MQPPAAFIDTVCQEIMPLEAYVSFAHEVPYTYQFSNARGSVTMVGVAHTYAFPHPVFTLIDTVFASVPLTTVIIEGIDVHFADQLTPAFLAQLIPAEAAKRGGEAIYTLQQAHAKQLAWTPAEPADDKLYAYLRALHFEPMDVLAWQVLRLLPQYIARAEQVSFAEYASPFISACQKATKWSVDYSLEAALQHATNVVGADLTDHNYDIAYSYTDPTAVTRRDNDYTVLNTLSATANVLRDRTMVRRVLQRVGNGEQVLVVCGAAHAVMQESAYRKYFEIT